MEAQPSSCSSSSSAMYPRWVLFEQSLVVADSSCSTTDDAKTRATARTSAGHPIQVSLRLAAPPALSRVFLRIPDGLKGETSKVLAAHGDSVLIQVRIQQKHHYQWWQYMTDHFVYNAGTPAADPPRPPSLLLLPPYYQKTKFPSLSGSDLVPRELDGYATGLLCRHDEVVVAELSTDTPRQAKLYLFRSGEWKLCNMKTREAWGSSFMSWHNVVPIDDHLLCWVDLFRGVLVVDVFQETPIVQCALGLPMDPHQGSLSGRNVCATAGGSALKFVNICCCEHSRQAGYTIHTWTLRMGDMEWVKDGMIDATELWALDAYKGLPCDPLDRPMVSTDEPEVICFRLRDAKPDSRTLWEIMVNMRSKTIRSVSRHERHYYSRDKLIPSNVSSYFFNIYPGNSGNDNAT